MDVRPTAKPRRLPSAALAAGAAAWLALVVASPYLVVHFSRGSACWRAGAAIYLAGHAICHQRADRSFRAWGVQLPVCGRCVGLYLGAAVGALVAAVAAGRTRSMAEERARSLPASWLPWFAVAVSPTLASLGLELVGIWAQTPGIRALAAVPLGLVVAWYVGTYAADVFGRTGRHV